MTTANDFERAPLVSTFKWNEMRSLAAVELAQGRTQREVAEELGVGERTIRTWMQHPEFAAEVDRLTLMVGIASRAERLRIAMRVARQNVNEDGTIHTRRDILDWLKYAQSETDAIRLELEKIAAAFGGDASSVAT
jgi:predicted transcriptional regulator